MKRVELGTVRPVARIRIIGALCAYEQVPWGHKAGVDVVFFRPVGWVREKVLSKQSEFQTERKE